MSSIEILVEIRTNLIEFVEDLRAMLPDEPDLIWYQLFIEKVPMVDVADYISRNIVPLEPKVVARDDAYFKQNAVLFERLGNFKSEVNRFKLLWDSKQDPKDREVVWSWLEHFIDLGKAYRSATQDH